MNNEIVQEKTLLQRAVLVAATILLAIAVVFFATLKSQVSDPYLKEVLSLEGDVAIGKAIFRANCAACHGIEADGSVGPSLHDISKRKSKVGLIKQVVSGKTPPMPKFQPNPQEMADLLSYLEQL